MKYSLKKGQQQEDVLVINGIDSVCPFVSGIPVQSEQHGFQILRVPCTSQCPHVSVSINDDNSVKYSISCTDTKTFDIEIYQPLNFFLLRNIGWSELSYLNKLL